MNIGDTYTWTPSAFEGASGICGFEKLKTVHGASSTSMRRTATLRRRRISTARGSERASNFRR